MRDVSVWIIGLLIAGLIWFGAEIVRLENLRYAGALGFCQEYDWREEVVQREDCLAHIRTRANPLEHLLHGLRLTR